MNRLARLFDRQRPGRNGRAIDDKADLMRAARGEAREVKGRHHRVAEWFPRFRFTLGNGRVFGAEYDAFRRYELDARFPAAGRGFAIRFELKVRDKAKRAAGLGQESAVYQIVQGRRVEVVERDEVAEGGNHGAHGGSLAPGGAA